MASKDVQKGWHERAHLLNMYITQCKKILALRLVVVVIVLDHSKEQGINNILDERIKVHLYKLYACILHTKKSEIHIP